MTNYIVEALIRASIIITILSIVILLTSKFVTKRLGYRWRKAAWLIMLACAIVPLRISGGSASGEIYQVEKQEKMNSEDVSNYNQSIKNTNDEILKENNLDLSTSKVYDKKKDKYTLPEETVIEKISDVLSKNSLIIVGVWLLGIYISWNIMILKEKQLKKVLSDNSFEIKEDNVINRIESIKQKVGYTRRLDVFYCTEISSPVVNGTINPKLYFPEDMDFEDEKIENVIRHEMIHLKSKDVLYKKILNYATIIYWFHPLIYIVKNKAFGDVEFVCDSEVVNGLGQNQIGMYCRTILETVPVKNSSVISFNNSKIRIKKRIDNCFSENKLPHHNNLYVLLGGVMAVIAITVGVIVGTLVHGNEKNGKVAKQIEKIVETTNKINDLHEEETTEVILRLSEKPVHYDTDFSISKEKSEALKKMWLDDLSESDCEIVKEKIYNVHSYMECELVGGFKGECPPDSEIWNNIDDDPNDNVIPGYTIPDMISDLENASIIVNKKSFSKITENIISKLQKLKKTHEIDLFYEIHQQVHDLSYWAINYPLENLELAPSDWHGIYVYFGTLDDL